MTAHPFLGDISPATFLADYWQQKPLLIRQAIPGFQSFIPPEEIAGLSLEEEVESRLVVQTAPQQWQLDHGPFDEQRFSQLPADGWSLLIQGADRWLEEVNALMREIDFIPSWRIDDVMISYATDQGSVGPHYDNYDVFLLQAEGERRWQLGQWCDHTTRLLNHSQVKLLEQLEVSAEYLLEPGDMLYVPTRLAHCGTSIGSSISYSFGFRAPATADLLSGFCDTLCATLHPEDRYVDTPLSWPTPSGEIDRQALQQVRQLLLRTLNNPALLEDFFGRFVTEPKFEEVPEAREVETITPDAGVQLCPGHRFAFLRSKSSRLSLFADGAKLSVDGALMTLCQQLARGKPITGPFSAPQCDLLTKLLALGTIELID
ncbi:JmjC domain-containing protein [Aestuariirhabdus sp. LZHN29]|uniref:JmjC domain-containing protein n=1 Tax=Aestuariirhabdus sp. LZHN29 TaxID=3417462 RepID=UPI003CF6367C